MGQGAQGKKEKAGQQIRQGKGIRVIFGEGVGLICGAPAKNVGPH